tara:strand:+ start:25086 stop:25844 length:759 start_codon:yes stop_codon:yes gene_type:complete
MLKNSFIHIPGVCADTEKLIWQNNILNWQEFGSKCECLALPEAKKKLIHQHIGSSLLALRNQKFNFFKNCLNENQHWRLYNELKDKCCFLDIETTGLSKHYNDITTIGIFNGHESKVFVKGQNMHEFVEEIKKYEMIVTFNGKTFDFPFIKEKFPEICLDKIHIDLRYPLARLGFKGGLKKIERDLGISRERELADMDGRQAVRLWYAYKRGNLEALELLKKYNIADVENLLHLMEFTFDKMKEKEFLSIIR